MQRPYVWWQENKTLHNTKLSLETVQIKVV